MLKLAIKEYNNNVNNKKYNIRIHDWEGRQEGPWIGAYKNYLTIMNVL